MPRGTTSDCETTVVQMFDPNRVARVTYRGFEWRVNEVIEIRTAQAGEKRAGHSIVVFSVDSCEPLTWDGPVGVVLHGERFRYELIPCSLEEYQRIPTQHASPAITIVQRAN